MSEASQQAMETDPELHEVVLTEEEEGGVIQPSSGPREDAARLEGGPPPGADGGPPSVSAPGDASEPGAEPPAEGALSGDSPTATTTSAPATPPATPREGDHTTSSEAGAPAEAERDPGTTGLLSGLSDPADIYGHLSNLLASCLNQAQLQSTAELVRNHTAALAEGELMALRRLYEVRAKSFREEQAAVPKVGCAVTFSKKKSLAVAGVPHAVYAPRAASGRGAIRERCLVRVPRGTCG